MSDFKTNWSINYLKTFLSTLQEHPNIIRANLDDIYGVTGQRNGNIVRLRKALSIKKDIINLTSQPISKKPTPEGGAKVALSCCVSTLKAKAATSRDGSVSDGPATAYSVRSAAE